MGWTALDAWMIEQGIEVGELKGDSGHMIPTDALHWEFLDMKWFGDNF